MGTPVPWPPLCVGRSCQGAEGKAGGAMGIAGDNGLESHEDGGRQAHGDCGRRSLWRRNGDIH